jgi:serine/threonine-protein kinase
MAIGTPAYMAPEQIEGKPATAASDRYALGAVFYEMLSGQQPFGAQTPLKAIARKLRDEVTPLRLNLPNLDGRLDEAIPRCLARDPPDRFARAADLLPLLEGAGWRSWLPRAWTFLSTAASLCVWRFSPPA